MNLSEIRELILLMRENQIAELDLEQEGNRVRIVSAQGAPTQGQPTPLPGTVFLTSTPGQVAAIAPNPVNRSAGGEEAVDQTPKGVTINSPIVGTFYRSPSPESSSYVEVGDDVEEETVLCIVEAMKVMNEIKAEIKAKILEILVENGHPVEFGQPIFRVSPFA